MKLEIEMERGSGGPTKIAKLEVCKLQKVKAGQACDTKEHFSCPFQFGRVPRGGEG